MRTIIVCGFALLMCWGCGDGDNPRTAQKRRAKVAEMVKAHWRSKHGFEVRGPLTLSQFEEEWREFYGALSEQGAEDNAFGRTNDPVGARIARKCDRVRLLRKEGDELYFFTSDRQSWSELDGMDGYVLVRKTSIVHGLVRSMN